MDDSKRINLKIGDCVKVMGTKSGVAQSGREWKYVTVGNSKVRDNLFLFDDQIDLNVYEGDTIRIDDMYMTCGREKTKGGEFINRWRPKVRITIVQEGGTFDAAEDVGEGDLPF